MSYSLFSTYKLSLYAGALSAFGLLNASADVKLPAIFGNHMVLQQETKLPVWGWAEPGEKVVVRFGESEGETVAGTDGKWRVDLPPQPQGTPAGTLVISGKNTITLKDVLVGEVWVCSGQSNMEWRLRSEETPAMEDDQIRVFTLQKRVGLEPCDDMKGSWYVCSPRSAGSFTAVGAYFATNLRPVLKRPVGLISTSWGATRAEAWTDLASLQANPALAHYVKDYQESAAHFPGGQAEYEAKASARNLEMIERSKKLQADTEFQVAWKAWNEKRLQGIRAEPPVAPVPTPPVLKVVENTPSVLFNGMIRPLIPFAIKGVIWYQGEGNATKGEQAFEYRTLFPTMIEGWRREWKLGDFPFLFVQLPNFRSSPKTAGDVAHWAMLRESQSKALSLPKTGMAVTIDVGVPADLHPPDKSEVGKRLAIAARRVAYGEDIAHTGPLFQSMTLEKGAAHLSFQPGSLGGGLVIGVAPGKDPSSAEESLRGFAIAGADKKWVWAEAKIVGDTVTVSSPEVPNPVAVRYAWADNPTCNLYNRAGLPASPFRTDEWNEF